LARDLFKSLRIAIATSSRFHVLDLARELHALGHQVKFYSFLPRSRATRFGLPSECHVGLLGFVAPLLAWEYVAPSLRRDLRDKLAYKAINRGLVSRLQPCDVMICMSGIYLEAPRLAKERYGARIWLERGNRHILSQDEILAAIPGVQRPSPFVIRRELEGYVLADRIVVPSAHVEQSFRSDRAASIKLFVNPYGVDLKMFPQRERAPANKVCTFVFAGRWSLRKGCDLLTAAVKGTPGTHLLHVGPLGDLAFPDGPQFTHLDAVRQWTLPKLYASADAFVHASREEGLSLVLAQALASGLPAICTDRTGGADLAHTPALAERITIVPHDDVTALSVALASHRDRAGTWPPLDQADRQTLSWTAYGKRYDAELQRAFA
jgi:glycosyltransferase involved in cell wall biosynthesis